MKEELEKFVDKIDKDIAIIAAIAKAIQDELYQWLYDNYTEITDNNIDDFLLLFRKKTKSISKKHKYQKAVETFAISIGAMRGKIIEMLNKYNNLAIPKSKWAQYGDFIDTITTDSLGSATKTISQTLPSIIMRNVAHDAPTKKLGDLLKKWHEGKQNTFYGIKAPNFAQYVEDNATNSSMLSAGAYSSLAVKEYGLNGFVYVGDLVKDSRPLCVHLIGLNRAIKLSEMPELINDMPNGLYPNTTEDNFVEVRGGYNCRHFAFPIDIPD